MFEKVKFKHGKHAGDESWIKSYRWFYRVEAHWNLPNIHVKWEIVSPEEITSETQ